MVKEERKFGGQARGAKRCDYSGDSLRSSLTPFSRRSFGQRATNQNFNGLFALDDFALYDRTLSPTEVQQKYAETTAFDPSMEQGLALYYR